MEKSFLHQFLTRKSLTIGLCFLLLVGLVVYVLNSSQENQQSPTPTPTPTESEVTVSEDENIPPDKQIVGQIIVEFKKQYTDAQINAHLKQYDAVIVDEIEGINQKVVEVPAGKENEIIEKLRQDPYVESAEGDYTNHLMFVPDDPLYVNQWGLNNTGQTIGGIAGIANKDVNADAAWDVSRGNGVKVAVLDTGINLTHPEFDGKIVAQRSFTTATVEDQAGHGTHVAGTITAVTNNNQGIAGTCPECQLIIGKVMGDNGSGSTSDIAAGITWAADQGAKVINLSLGTTTAGSANTYQAAVDYAIGKGAVVVASAGNCGGTNFASNGCTSQNQNSYPGFSSGVVTVGATDNLDAKASFSNYGTYVEVSAPGRNIYATGPNHSFAKQPSGYNFASPYYYSSGTSMSAPMVAGVIGLIWTSQYGTSSTTVINRLYATADKIAGTGTFWSQGRVNAAAAVGTATATVVPSVVTPTFVCGGSGTGNVCPPTPSTIPTVFLSPTIGSTTGIPSPSTPQTTTQPTSPITSVNPTQPGGGGPIGGGPGRPCRSANQMVYRRADSTNQQGYKARIKTENTSKPGFFHAFFDLLFRIIQWLLQLIGRGTPCTV